MNFDFSAPDYHELALWKEKTTLRIECADTYIALLEKPDRAVRSPTRITGLDL